MNSNLHGTNLKRPKVYIDLWVTIAVLTIVPAYHITRSIAGYRWGLTFSSFWESFYMLAPMLVLLALGLILFLIIRLAVLNVRFGIKRLSLQIIFIIASASCFLMVPKYVKNGTASFMKGFHENMEANADIPAIQGWLDSLDWDNMKGRKYADKGWLIISLPDAMKKLPHHHMHRRIVVMKSADNKKYVRVIYGGGAVVVPRWSLVVGVGADEIPLDDLYKTEYRLELAPNAFIGWSLN